MLAVEFDGIGQGFSRDGAYVSRVTPMNDPYRSLKLRRKLEACEAADFPLVILSFEEIDLCLQRTWQQLVPNSEFWWHHVAWRFAPVGGVTVATPLKRDPLGGGVGMRSRALNVCRLILVLAAILVGSGWPTPFTLVSLIVLPAGLALLPAIVKPASILDRPWLTHYIRGASLLSLLSCTVWGGIVWSEMKEPELHLLPQGYTGEVLIIFNVADGTPPSYDGTKRLYEIPETGVLRSQFSPNRGRVAHPGTSSYAYVQPGEAVLELPNTISIVGEVSGTAMQIQPPCDVRYKAYALAEQEWEPGRLAGPDILSYLQENPVSCNR